MGRPAYTTLLLNEPSLSGVNEFSAPPAGYLQVVRFAGATFGSYEGSVGMALGLSDAGPWSWLCTPGIGLHFATSPVTFYWEGRYVLPAAVPLFIKISPGDTCDVYLSGYQLSVDG